MPTKILKKGEAATRLKDFIDCAIVPILVKEYLAQSQELPNEKAKLDPPIV